MAGVTDAALLDLLQTTQENLPWDGQFEVLQKHIKYQGVNDWFGRMSVKFHSGTSIVRKVQVTESGAAHFTRPYATETPSVGDVMEDIDLPWRLATTNYSIARSEMLRNRKKARLIELVKSRRIDALMDMANLLQENIWLSPPTTADEEYPHGVDYWMPHILYNATAGFVGGIPTDRAGTSFSDCGGISPTTHSRWKSYADAWTNSGGAVVDADLKKMRTMYRKLGFQSPTIVDDLKGFAKNFKIYSNDTTIGNLEDLARQQNDQLGADVGKFAEATSFKRIPIQYVDVLDDDIRGDDSSTSAYPLYYINHAYWEVYCMEDDYFRESDPMNTRDQHRVYTTFTDLQFNTLCTNRQRGGGVIGYKTA